MPIPCSEKHCLRLDADGFDHDGPVFLGKFGGYCAKQGVVDTVRSAVESAGMKTIDHDGNYIFCHTLRITGARYLSATGLDPITIQLLGR